MSSNTPRYHAFNYLAQIPIHIRGIPALAGITSFYHERPTATSRPDTPTEAFGDVEFTWEPLDRRGRYAAWLDRKLTPAYRPKLDTEILAIIKKEKIL